jgi:type VII secretion integral membrane protein EccD
LTIVAARRSLDLAVPATTPLADVLPAIVDLLGAEVAREFAGRGVVLQTLGSAPLDDEQTTAALGLRDGDVVYLRTREAATPTFERDDLVDGVAESIRGRPGRWSPMRTRATSRAAAALALVGGAASLLTTRHGWAACAIAAVLAVVLLGVAALISRAVGDRHAGLIWGASSVLYAGVSGFVAPAVAGVLPARLAAAAALTAAMSVAAAIAVGNLRPMVFTIVTCSAAMTVGALLTASSAMSRPAAAGLVAALALLFSPTIPSLAFRLAGMRLPDLPNTPEDVTRDVDPIPESVMIERTAVADQYVTAAYLSVAAIAAAGVWLLVAGDLVAMILGGAVCALMLLRSRMLTGAWARWALMLGAATGLLAIIARLYQDSLLWLGGLPVAALVLAIGLLASTRIPEGRPIRPYWGRAAELLESMLALSLIPLLLAVLGVYGFVRGLGG